DRARIALRTRNADRTLQAALPWPALGQYRPLLGTDGHREDAHQADCEDRSPIPANAKGPWPAIGTYHRSPTTNHQSPIANNHPTPTNHQPLITHHLITTPQSPPCGAPNHPSLSTNHHNHETHTQDLAPG